MASFFDLDETGRSISGANDRFIVFSDCALPVPVLLPCSTASNPKPECDNIVNGTSFVENFKGCQAQPSATGTLLDGIFKNLAITNIVTSQEHSCTCDDGGTASSYCFLCKEYLCNKCVSAHNRVKLTKGHPIEHVNKIYNDHASSQISTNRTHSTTGPGMLSYCTKHVGRIIQLYCELCSLAICDNWAVFSHEGHKVKHIQEFVDEKHADIISLISQSRLASDSLENVSQEILKTIRSLDVQANSVCLEIKKTFCKLANLLEQREQELISNVQKIRQVKFHALNSQFDEVRHCSHTLLELTNKVIDNIKFYNETDLLKAKKNIIEELNISNQQMRNSSPSEDHIILFTTPDPTIQHTLKNIAKVSSYASAAFSAISSDNSNSGMSNQDIYLSVSTSNHLGEPCDVANDLLHIDVRDLQENLVHHQVTSKQDGTISLKFCPSVQGNHRVSVTIRGKDVIDSPFCIFIRPTQPCLTNRSEPRLTFGESGEKDGQLCRPWGIACDHNGNFIVADRSNNRIQVFSSSGFFMHKFGKVGSYPGMLNRPAGLTVDSQSRIIVADKDNHRIQVFSLDGDFIFLFGERGSRNGQFYYPWDVATSSEGMIAVTDTRNHRIQIFDKSGKFIGKYGFEGILWKHFDSPRGISFANNDQTLVVTDFNNHRLVIVQSDLKSARFLGSEGNQPSQFLRPQGVAIDDHGNYVVADSRNNRLQIFSPCGTVVAVLGGSSKIESKEMDRPSGLAITRDSGIAVVDFGNDRIIVY